MYQIQAITRFAEVDEHPAAEHPTQHGRIPGQEINDDRTQRRQRDVTDAAMLPNAHVAVLVKVIVQSEHEYYAGPEGEAAESLPRRAGGAGLQSEQTAGAHADKERAHLA